MCVLLCEFLSVIVRTKTHAAAARIVLGALAHSGGCFVRDVVIIFGTYGIGRKAENRLPASLVLLAQYSGV